MIAQNKLCKHCIVTETTSADDTAKENNTATEPSEAPASEKVIEVDESHPEVQAMVAAAVKVAEEQTVTLPAEQWIEVMEQTIKDAEGEMWKRNSNGPKSVFIWK